MKTLLTWMPVFLFSFFTAVASGAAESDNPVIVERGPHHRVLERTTTEVLSDGRTVERKSSYTAIGTGLHYRNEQGEWVESREEIELFRGAAVARQGQHQVIFAANLNSPGSIDLLAPDGKRFSWYMPEVQRWSSRDPRGEPGHEALHQRHGRGGNAYAELLPEGANLYTFVGNRPVVLYDIDGRNAGAIGIGAVGILGLRACLANEACRIALAAAIGGILDRCLPRIGPAPGPRNGEWCPLEDQHDMGPVAGYRCEYWCRKSGQKVVNYVPHHAGGCPKYFLKE